MAKKKSTSPKSPKRKSRPAKLVTRTCVKCGTSFEGSPSRNFCSTECRAAARYNYYVSVPFPNGEKRILVVPPPPGGWIIGTVGGYEIPEVNQKLVIRVDDKGEISHSFHPINTSLFDL